MPFLWVTGDDHEVFEEKVRGSEYVKEVAALDCVEDSVLYHITWRGDHNDIIQAIIESQATILEAQGDDDTWKYHVRFNDHDKLSQFHNYCTDHELSRYRLVPPKRTQWRRWDRLLR